jgi:hypothetical protein
MVARLTRLVARFVPNAFRNIFSANVLGLPSRSMPASRHAALSALRTDLIGFWPFTRLGKTQRDVRGRFVSIRVV